MKPSISEKEVTNRATQKIIQRTKEERTSKTNFEFEEKNYHLLDNTGGSAHVSGLFLWVNKVYNCRIRNYGQRTMYQFMIPRPALFHLQAMEQPSLENQLSIDKPIAPSSADIIPITGNKLTVPTDINKVNYVIWAGAYNVELPPPPQDVIELSYGISGSSGTPDNQNFAQTTYDLIVPEGYIMDEIMCEQNFLSSNSSGKLSVYVGGQGATYGTPFNQNNSNTAVWTANPSFAGNTPLYVSAMGWVTAYAASFTLICNLTQEAREQWQLKCYNLILSAYEKQKSQYDMALSALETRQGINIKGTNPLMNEEIIKTELKKWSMFHLFPIGTVPGHPFDPEFSSWAMVEGGNYSGGTPFFSSAAAQQDGKRVKFAEHVFEWENMVYQLYPYYWTPEHFWKLVYTLNDSDPLFQQFLQAGYARVVVPVRPGMESHLASFFATDQIPEGEGLPYDDPSLVALLGEDLGDSDSELEAQSWQIRIPTSLVVLQCGSGCVEGNGLPCNCPETPEHPNDGIVFTPTVLSGPSVE